ncbi:MAG: hypothetical protein ACM3JP_03055, partial [Betaproteobacteria bacterium]
MAILFSAAAAASQVGLGYGLGVIAWSPLPGKPTATDSGAWPSNLAWTALIAATSVVIGAVAADRLGHTVHIGRTSRALRRVVVCLAAAVGGAALIPLVVVPAQYAQVDATFAPHILVGVYAAVGLVAGLIVALPATAVRAIAANVFATVGWLWALAIIVLINRSVAAQRPGYVPLGVWKFTENGPTYGRYYLPGALIMLGSALLIGGLAAFPSAGRGARRLGIVISGAIGPLLIAGAYRLADPDPTKTPFEELSAFYLSPYVAVAGLVGA